MSKTHTYDRIFELISDIRREEQRDIFSIIVNMLSMDESSKSDYEDFYKYLLNLTAVEKNDTTQLLIQEKRIKLNYELIILDELSIVGKKYLNFLLEYISNTTKNKIYTEQIQYIISVLFYEDQIKSNIEDYVSTYMDTNGSTFNQVKNSKLDKVYHDQQSKIIKELTSNSLTSINKKKSLIDKATEKVIEVTALSPKDGDYGIKFLSKNRSDTIHIFINGFTNDNKKDDSYREWLKESRDIINQDDIFCGFDWPSGKNLLYHILELLKKCKGNAQVLAIEAIVTSIRALPEWKNARNNSITYSENLSIFIEDQHKKNPDIKINIYGHSLGANLIRHTLGHLHKKEIKIEDVFLFGGASDIDEISWTNYMCVAKNIYNFYSKNDQILKILYQVMELGEPIGLNPIKYKQINKLELGNIYNYDVSYTIDSHTEYIEKFSSLYGLKYRN